MPKKRPEAFPLLAYADQLVEQLRELTPRAIKQQEIEAIHDTRVITRRLGAMIKVLEPVLSGNPRRRFARALRKLRKNLGTLRDDDVMLQHLADLSKGRSTAAGEWLIKQIRDSRDKAQKQVTRKIAVSRILGRLGTWWGVREELAECKPAIDSLLAESLHLQLDAFAERAHQLGSKLNGEEIKEGSPEDPHALRISGKALRYTLEMAVVEGHALPAQVGNAFKSMQSALGDWHDSVVLATRAMKEASDQELALHDPDLLLAVLKLTHVITLRGQRDLKRFHRIWQTDGEELSKAIRETFTLTRPGELPAEISGRQMDPGLADLKEVPPPADPQQAGPAGASA